MVSKRLLSFLWAFALWAALTVSANGQERVGNPPGAADKGHPVPVQTYAIIDLSGTSTTAPVTAVGLNDNNQASFGVGTGTPSIDTDGYTTYTIYTWQNGQISSAQINCLVQGAHDECTATSDGYTRWDKNVITLVTGAGKGYGTQYQVCVPDDLNQPGGHITGTLYRSMYSTTDDLALPSPPFGINASCDQGQWHGSGVVSASDSGWVVGWESTTALMEPTGTANYYVLRSPQGHFTVFDTINDYSNVTLPSNVTLQSEFFSPIAVNSSGITVGYGAGGAKLWDGSQLKPMDDGEPQDLNDQGQVVVRKEETANGEVASGYLWEENQGEHIAILNSKLPKALRGQLTNIQPFSISNQAVPAPAANADATIHILATAKDNGADVTLVCTRDHAGTWTFAEVQLPEGVTLSDYTTINSSGVIAAIGNAGTGDGHALLLVPCDIEPDASYHGNGSVNQTSTVGTNDITPDSGNVGDMVDSTFKGDPSKHPQKHYVSPKNTIPGPVGYYLAFKSGMKPELASNFKWIIRHDDQTTSSPNDDASHDVLISRNEALHVTLELQSKKDNKTPSDKMNVWVVWAKGTFEYEVHPTWINSYGTCSDGSYLRAAAFTTRPSDTGKYYKFRFDIEPKEITNVTKDIPNLTGPMDPKYPPPGGLHIVWNTPLKKGADRKWDVTRKMQFEIKNPDGILPSKLPFVAGDLYKDQPKADFIPAPWPVDPDDVEGNDDHATNDEENNPYYVSVDVSKQKDHPRGSVVSIDAPSFTVFDDGHRNNGDIFVQDARFSEFLRLQIGKKWYHVSDNINWHHIMKAKYHIGFTDRYWMNNNSSGGHSD